MRWMPLMLLSLTLAVSCERAPTPAERPLLFDCPVCGKATLDIVKSMQLGPTDDDDTWARQIVYCADDDFEAIAEYTASRRGGDDSFHHHGKEATPEFRDELRQAIDSCDYPGEAKCNCAGHQKVRRMDFQSQPGEWFRIREETSASPRISCEET